LAGFNYQETGATLLRDGLKEIARKEKFRSEDLNQEAGGRLILRMDTAKHRHPPRKVWIRDSSQTGAILTHPCAKSKTNFEWYNLMPYFHPGVAQAQ